MYTNVKIQHALLFAASISCGDIVAAVQVGAGVISPVGAAAGDASCPVAKFQSFNFENSVGDKKTGQNVGISMIPEDIVPETAGHWNFVAGESPSIFRSLLVPVRLSKASTLTRRKATYKKLPASEAASSGSLETEMNIMFGSKWVDTRWTYEFWGPQFWKSQAYHIFVTSATVVHPNAAVALPSQIWKKNLTRVYYCGAPSLAFRSEPLSLLQEQEKETMQLLFDIHDFASSECLRHTIPNYSSQWKKLSFSGKLDALAKNCEPSDTDKKLQYIHRGSFRLESKFAAGKREFGKSMADVNFIVEAEGVAAVAFVNKHNAKTGNILDKVTGASEGEAARHLDDISSDTCKAGQIRDKVTGECKKIAKVQRFNELMTRLWPWDMLGVEVGNDFEYAGKVRDEMNEKRKELAVALDEVVEKKNPMEQLERLMQPDANILIEAFEFANNLPPTCQLDGQKRTCDLSSAEAVWENKRLIQLVSEELKKDLKLYNYQPNAETGKSTCMEWESDPA